MTECTNIKEDLGFQENKKQKNSSAQLKGDGLFLFKGNSWDSIYIKGVFGAIYHQYVAVLLC